MENKMISVLLLFIILRCAQCIKNWHTPSITANRTYVDDVSISMELPRDSGRACSVSSANVNLTMILKLLIVRQYSEIPFILTYRVEMAHFTNIDIENWIDSERESGNLILASFTRELNIITKRVNDSDKTARLLLYINTPDRVDNATLRVFCNKANPEEPDESDKDTLEVIESICSAALVIILSALNVAFLLIILIVSIMLCCVMPKRQRLEIKKIRQSMLLDADTTFSKVADRIRPETVIYDDATAQRKTIFGDTSNVSARQEQQYANPSFRQSSFYQNI